TRASFRLPSIIPISPNFWTEAFGPFKGIHFLQVSALQNSDASLCAKIAHFRGQYVWSKLSFYLMAVFHFTHGIAYSDFRTTTEKGGSSTFATPPLTLMDLKSVGFIRSGSSKVLWSCRASDLKMLPLNAPIPNSPNWSSTSWPLLASMFTRETYTLPDPSLEADLEIAGRLCP